MGSCLSRICPCCCKQESDETEPLIKGQDTSATHVPYQRGSVSSARKTSVRPSVDKGVGVGAQLRKLNVGETGIADLDKQYKVRANAYNECFDRYDQLSTCYHRMLATYDSRGITPSHLSGVFKVYKDELSDDAKKNMNVKRKYQFCMQLDYKQEYLPEDDPQIFQDFNTANVISKELIEKEPVVVGNAMEMVNKEEEYKTRIMEFYAERKKKCPEKLKICIQNTAEMGRVQPFMDYIKKETCRMFEDMKESARVFMH